MSSITTVVGAFGMKPKLIARPRSAVNDGFELDVFPQLVSLYLEYFSSVSGLS